MKMRAVTRMEILEVMLKKRAPRLVMSELETQKGKLEGRSELRETLKKRQTYYYYNSFAIALKIHVDSLGMHSKQNVTLAKNWVVSL